MARSFNLVTQSIRDVTIVDFNQPTIVDPQQVQEMDRQLADLIDGQARKKLILDFSKVKTLSSSAIGTLLSLQKKADGMKGKVVLCGVQKEVRQVFKISGLHKLFTFCKSEEAALGKFGVTTAG